MNENEDDILKAQHGLMDFLQLPEVSPIDLPKPTIKNPNINGGGGVIRKALRLESEAMLLWPLLIIFSITLSFVLGFYLGSMRERSVWLEKRLSQLEGRGSEYNLPAAKQQAIVPVAPLVKHVPQSSVLKYPTPQASRKQSEQQAENIIEKEMLKLAKEFGGGGSVEVI